MSLQLFFSLGSAQAARRSEKELKNCLTGHYRVTVSATIRGFDPPGVPVAVIPVSQAGKLKIAGKGASFKGLLLQYDQILNKGSRKLVIRGGTKSESLANSAKGYLKIVIVKRGVRARVKTGRLKWRGRDAASGTLFRATDGRISGSRRLPASCRH